MGFTVKIIRYNNKLSLPSYSRIDMCSNRSNGSTIRASGPRSHTGPCSNVLHKLQYQECAEYRALFLGHGQRERVWNLSSGKARLKSSRIRRRFCIKWVRLSRLFAELRATEQEVGLKFIS
jgi:hypothetical protein